MSSLDLGKGIFSFLIDINTNRLSMHSGQRRITGRSGRVSEEEVMQEIQMEQIEIERIQRQREMIEKISGVVEKKDREVGKLRQMVEKYREGYEESVELRLQLSEKESAIKTLKG